MASVETEKSKNVLTLTKKTKLKLSEQIRMATKMSSPASVLSLPTTLASKSKKKSHVFNHISENAKETASQKLNLTELTPATNQTKDAKETKKKQLQAVFLNKTSSNDAKVNVKSVTSDSKESFWSEDTGKHKDWRENDSREAKITLQDVRTALGRVKQNGHREFIVEKSATEDLQSESRTQNQVSLVTAVQSVSGVTPKSEKREVVLLKSEDFMGKPTKIQNLDCAFSQRADSLSEGLKMDHHTMGLASLSTPARLFLETEIPATGFRSHLVPVLRQTVERNKSVLEKRKMMDVGKQTTADLKNNGARTQQPLGQVTLRELPHWLSSRRPRRPRDVLELAQRGWQWYQRRYIDVKQGGVGGVAMLLVGYCILSYICSYPRLKRDRWRKYH